MFVIYGNDNCSYCRMAVSFMSQHGFEYEYKKVSLKENAIKLRSLAPAARTIPQIFLDDRHIGGYTELLNAHKSGTLTS